MILSLRLKNFRRYRDATLEFTKGVNFIEGANNVGKTTLLYAIEYALFGRVDGYKTISGLMHPGTKAMGVELIFESRGVRYRLQRAHIRPPRSRTTINGHFTLKQVNPEGEKYLMSSDFDDTDDKLLMRLQELTGLTRRLFAVAVNMKQGTIADILNGSPQLDIVLGVTAAVMAEEELRAMALELEKEAAALPVLQERRKTMNAELEQIALRLSAIGRERSEAGDLLARMGAAADPRAALEAVLSPLGAAMDRLRGAAAGLGEADRRLAEERSRQEAALARGDMASVEAGLAEIAQARGRQQAQAGEAQEELRALDQQRSGLDQQRGDLSGRIARRSALPTAAADGEAGGDPTCEACGAPIDAAHNAREIAMWQEELAGLEAQLGALLERRQAESARLEEARRRMQEGQLAEDALRRQGAALLSAEALVATRQADRAGAAAGLAAAAEQLTAAAAAATGGLYGLGMEVQLSGSHQAEQAEAWLGLLGSEISGLRLRVAEEAGRRAAEREALVALCGRLEGEERGFTARQAELEREVAALNAQITVLERKVARAERFRRVGAGFKTYQLKVRSDASQQLAVETLALHRQLTGGAAGDPADAGEGEFTALTIDPARYSVEVVPKDIGESVPAGLYEGGGHRLLLGLAFRLAVVRRVGSLPFVLLDEPTYGLDVANREQLLNRIAGLGVADQFLLITHQAMGEVQGRRIRVVRKGKETVVESTRDAGMAGGAA